uniref:metallophosphoesterase family protein n=1 Tax=uncultured Draconibacterium sp. TaxID=1573823 RepID=UPI003216C7F9
MKKSFILLVFILQNILLFGQKDFSFVFLPDIHLSPDSAVVADFDNVIKKVNKLNPDFILTGGDMIYTAKNVDEKKAKILFDFMDVKFKQLNMPIYYGIGNHEIVGLTAESGMDTSHPLWGKAMYEKRYGKRYRSFIHSGWKFILLDGMKILEEKRNYATGVDSVQINWLKNELNETDKKTPIVIFKHTPFIFPKALYDSQSQALSAESEAILNLFNDHNLKMVLQGHNHVYMNLLINGIHYISGGSTWFEPHLGLNNGFVFVTIKNNTADIKFIETGIDTNK